MDLFAEQKKQHRSQVEPLAARMRPRTLEEFLGQEDFLGEGKLLRRMLEADRLSSALFYGPAGTGKTTLATVIAARTSAYFAQVNAAAVGVKEVRVILDDARQRLEASGQRTIFFVDELHRFSKSQQDVLLGDVENGTVILIGATTENPFFAINTPLISRSQIFQFQPLSTDNLKKLMHRAIKDSSRGLGKHHVSLSDEAADHLAKICDGDARRALTALEIAVLSQVCSTQSEAEVVVDLEVAAESIQRKAITYDAGGDGHYDSISAMIKSIRGSDPDAAVYWLARMLEGGEDPRFVARRIIISASEDIGNAEPRGLILAQSAAAATLVVGMPECQLILAQAVIYLASAPKSNACAKAIWGAAEDVRTGQTIPVPKHLKSAKYKSAEKLGSGIGYQYPHDAQDGIVKQDYLGVDKFYYLPTDRGWEAQAKAYLEQVRRIQSDGQ